MRARPNQNQLQSNEKLLRFSKLILKFFNITTAGASAYLLDNANAGIALPLAALTVVGTSTADIYGRSQRYLSYKNQFSKYIFPLEDNKRNFIKINKATLLGLLITATFFTIHCISRLTAEDGEEDRNSYVALAGASLVITFCLPMFMGMIDTYIIKTKEKDLQLEVHKIDLAEKAKNNNNETFINTLAAGNFNFNCNEDVQLFTTILEDYRNQLQKLDEISVDADPELIELINTKKAFVVNKINQLDARLQQLQTLNIGLVNLQQSINEIKDANETQNMEIDRFKKNVRTRNAHALLLSFNEAKEQSLATITSMEF